MRKATRKNTPLKGPHPFAFLTAWRERAHLTQAKVAATFDVTDVTIHRWETGKAPVTNQDWVLLATLFGAEHPGHLFYPPDSLHEALALQDALPLIRAMSPTDLQRWFDVGKSLAAKTGVEEDSSA